MHSVQDSSSTRIATKLKRRSLLRLRAAPAVRSPRLVTPSRVRNTIAPGPSSSTIRPRLGQPLPNRLQTGRATTFGTNGVSRPVAGSTIPRAVSRNIPTPAATRSTLVRGASLVKAVKPKSEMEILREKVKSLEEKMRSTEERLATSTEMNGLLKENLERVKGNMESCQERVTTLTEVNENLKFQNESTKTKLEISDGKVVDLTEQLEAKESLLRKLHNDVVDLRGQIRVAVRVRPLLPSEDASTGAITYPAINSLEIDLGGKSSQFEFERVFTPVFSQEEVFDCVKELVLSCLHGYNVSLIAFGQTGSGKTHTMRGGQDEKEGVIPRSARLLLENAEKLAILGWKFDFSLRFIEIYNNEAYDLLNNHEKLKLRLAGHDVSIDGVSDHPVTKFSDVSRLLRTADGNRKTAATKCNAQSSRSHAIFQWNVKASQESTGISTTSVLKLVDLAGSERAKDSEVVGDRFKEMTHINQSLSTLQKCISLQKQKAGHVPYRDSKLTQLLKDCLGAGSSKTMVIVNVNPSEEQLLESKRSVEFAAKMRDTKIGAATHQRDTTLRCIN